MGDVGIIIGVLVGAWVLGNMSAKQSPQASPAPAQPIRVNPRMILATTGNPGTGPMPTPVNTLSYPAPNAYASTPFVATDVGYATDLGPVTSLGRCKPDGTCFQ